MIDLGPATALIRLEEFMQFLSNPINREKDREEARVYLRAFAFSYGTDPAACRPRLRQPPPPRRRPRMAGRLYRGRGQRRLSPQPGGRARRWLARPPRRLQPLPLIFYSKSSNLTNCCHAAPSHIPSSSRETNTVLAPSPSLGQARQQLTIQFSNQLDFF
jgi:hypothetical protein